MNDNTTGQQKLIIAGVLILVGYFGIIKPITDALGLTKSNKDLLDERKRQAIIDAEKKRILALQQPTKTEFEWQAIADELYNDVRYTSWDDNYDDATYQAARVKNNADFVILYEKFGLKREWYLGVFPGLEADLYGMLNANLPAGKIEALNDNYKRKGIQYRI